MLIKLGKKMRFIKTKKYIIQNKYLINKMYNVSLCRKKYIKHDLFVPFPKECNINCIETVNENTALILVHLGHKFPWHIYECLQQLQTFHKNEKIIFIGSSQYVLSLVQQVPGILTYFYNDVEIVRKIENIQSSGLFTFSIARFWAIYDCMNTLGLENCIHIEHDNLIYAPLNFLFHMCKKLYGDKLAIPKDTKDRCIAGFMWIGSKMSLQKYMNYVETNRFNQYEMFSLGSFVNSNNEHSEILPVVPTGYTTLDGLVLDTFAEEWDGIFDAAAIGQWVGGIDTIHTSDDTRGFINYHVVSYCIESFPVVWTIDPNGNKIPLVQFNNRYYRLYNIHIHSKMLHFYTSKQWEGTYDIIQGEKFKKLCPIQIHEPKDIHIFLTNYIKGHETLLIYVKTDLVNDFFEVVWPKLQNPVVLVTHNADHGVEKHHLKYLNSSNLVFWFAQNCNVTHAKLQEIPIGLANSEWKHGDAETFVNTINKYKYFKKYKLIYNNFSDTHPSRVTARQILTDLPTYKEETIMTPSEFWKKLCEFTLVFCPRGNGIDTHRLWETWYAGNIPILFDGKNNEWAKIFHKAELPKLELSDDNNWKSCLYKSYYQWWKDAVGRRELRFSYWNSMIQLRLSSVFTKFDICIVVHPKDFDLLNNVIFGLQRYTFNYRNIYIITTNEGMKQISFENNIAKECIHIINEKEVEPCSFDYVKQHGFGWRTGWYYQQLLKLYLDKIPGILNRFLIMDADTVVQKECMFWDSLGRSMFHINEEFEEEYYRKYVLQMIPELEPLKYEKCTAVVHHMPIEVSVLKEMRKKVENIHNMEFWNCFLKLVHKDERQKSGASEYELYFQYFVHFHSEKYVIRRLINENTGSTDYLNNKKYDMVSIHSYIKNI